MNITLLDAENDAAFWIKNIGDTRKMILEIQEEWPSKLKNNFEKLRINAEEYFKFRHLREDGWPNDAIFWEETILFHQCN